MYFPRQVAERQAIQTLAQEKVEHHVTLVEHNSVALAEPNHLNLDEPNPVTLVEPKSVILI